MNSIWSYLGIGLLLAATTMATEPTSLAADGPAMSFQLPLPGESLPAEGSGLLVQVDSTIQRVRFHWFGPDSGSAQGQVQFEGFFQAQTGALKPGTWVLEAQGFDAMGKLVARRSQEFQVGPLSGPELSPQAAAAGPRVIQDVYVATNLGFNFGVTADKLRSYRSLQAISDTSSLAGAAFEPFDRILSGSFSMLYHLQQGAFRLKVRTVTDATETWGHAQSPTRLGADLYWSSWAEAHLGDQYPAWSPLLMDGSRIRGLGIGVAAVANSTPLARADIVIGSQHAAIAPQIHSWDDYTDTIPSQLQRDIQAVHLGIGDGSPAAWNLTLIHSSDKMAGIDQTLHDQLGGLSPRENLGFGTDITSKFWKNRIEFYLSSAFTVTTDDTRQNRIVDSLRNSDDLAIPSIISDLMSVNLTTRGVEWFARGRNGISAFLWENMALRAGGRLLLPLSGAGRLRLDSRWVHLGSQFQSFARSIQETPRTGLEWSATSALAKDALLVVLSGAELQTHPAQGLSIPTHSANLNIAWTPIASPFSWHAQSGTQTSGGGQQARNQSWNAGGGLFGTLRSSTRGSLHWRTSYSYFQNLARIPITTFRPNLALPTDSQFTTISMQSTIQTHTADVQVRWRPWRNLEGRGGYTLASQGFPGDTNSAGQTRTHRIQSGVSSWLFSRRLEIAIDGSLVLRPDQTTMDATGWDQTARLTWNLADNHSLHASQRWARLIGGRQDTQFEAGWEAWF